MIELKINCFEWKTKNATANSFHSVCQSNQTRIIINSCINSGATNCTHDTRDATCNMLYDFCFCYEWTHLIQHVAPACHRYVLTEHMLRRTLTHALTITLHSKSHLIVVCIYAILILHTVPFWCNGLVRNWNRNLKINRHNIWTADAIHVQSKKEKKNEIKVSLNETDEILNDAHSKSAQIFK